MPPPHEIFRIPEMLSSFSTPARKYPLDLSSEDKPYLFAFSQSGVTRSDHELWASTLYPASCAHMIAGTQQLHKKRNILYSISFTINPISALNPLFRTRRSYIMDQPRIKRQSGILLHLLRGTERKIMSLLFLPGFYPGFDQF